MSKFCRDVFGGFPSARRRSTKRSILSTSVLTTAKAFARRSGSETPASVARWSFSFTDANVAHFMCHAGDQAAKRCQPIRMTKFLLQFCSPLLIEAKSFAEAVDCRGDAIEFLDSGWRNVRLEPVLHRPERRFDSGNACIEPAGHVPRTR